MNLEDLLKIIDDVDEELIIFQKNVHGIDSEIELWYGEKTCDIVIVQDGIKYLYLLEVFLAKEFIEDLIAGSEAPLTTSYIAQRLYEYAINDA